MGKTLFCVSGRTASGKDTLSAEVCAKFGLKKLLSYTTRTPRSEFDETHIFTTQEKFDEFRRNNQIGAYSKIGDYYYWSTVEQLHNNDIYVVDYVGLKQIKALNMPDVKIVTIYIKAPQEERHKRAYLRDPNVDTYWARNKAEQEQFDELEATQDYDYLIYNSRFADACKCFDEIVIAERSN